MPEIRLCFLALSFAAAVSVHGAPLFDAPLHVTRNVEEPISGKTLTVDEYYFGSRVVTVRGSRTVIADYDKREVTEIDRAAGTYSVTKFEDVAAARGARRATQTDISVQRSGNDRRGGRSVDLFTADDKNSGMHAEVAVDANVELTKDAFDVVVGAAYPAGVTAGTEIARGAARRSRVTAAANGMAAPSAERYGLPIEQTFRWHVGKETVTATNRITRVGDETVPPDVIAIPAGARRVESRRIEANRLAGEIDSTPSTRKH
jgi:hypothetical protein